MNQENFYKHLFSKCSDVSFSITTLPNRQIYHFSNLDEMLESIPNYQTNTYINICPRRENMPSSVRGGVEDVKYLPCLFADIDVKGDAHKNDNLPQTKEEAITFLKNLAFTPTYIVDSGYGVYAFWVFDEPYLIDTQEDRLKANSILSGYGKYLISEFKENGWQLDNVFDLPRMLRAPSSKNYKLNKLVDCEVIEFNDVFYDISDFDSYADEIVEYEVVEFETDERVIGSASRIMEQCPFIRKMIDEPNNVTEPEWQAMCSNVVLTPDGKELFHEWSSLYNGYTFEETQYKIERALVSKKPCTCTYIKECLGFSCEGCGVKAPVVLAHYSKLEQLQALPEKLTAEEIYEDYLLKLASYAKEHLPAEYGKLKIKVKRSGVGLRDFERAVRNYIEKFTPLEFDIVQKEISLDGIDLNGAIEPVGYQISLDEGISSVRYEEGIAIPVHLCHEPVVITKRLENIDNGIEKVELSMYRNGRWKTIVAPRSNIFSKNAIMRYADNGLAVTTDNAEGMVRYLSAYEVENTKVIPFIKSIGRIGWIGKEFYPYNTSNEYVYENTDSENIIDALVSNGDVNTWISTYKALRKSIFARAIIVNSFASPLLELLKHRVIVLHVWHSSRSGKTAVLKFALSIWGDPLKLMGNYNSTKVGLERRAGTLKHLPLGLDELQVLDEKRLSTSHIIYSLGNGFGKTRGAKNGGLQDVPNWRNSVISTGEQPICNENSMDGVNTRVLELYGQPISNTEFGRNIHQISENNYGLVASKYIEFISNKDNISEDFAILRDKIKDKFDELKIGDVGAHLDNVTVLALADLYSSVAILKKENETSTTSAITFAVELLKNIKSLEKEDVIERAWNCVQDFVASNRKRFSMHSVPCYGTIEPKKVYVIPNVLREELEQNSFSYLKCTKGFQERGYIETIVDSENTKRFQVQKKIQGVNVRAICLNIELSGFDEPEDDFLK